MAIITYCRKFPSDIYPPEVPEPGVITPDPRSWVSLSEVAQYQAAKGFDPFDRTRGMNGKGNVSLDYLTLLAKGYVGGPVSINFVTYIRKEYKVHTAEDILNKWDEETAKEFQSMPTAEVSFYSNEVVAHIKKAKKLTPKQGANLAEFLISIPKESASGFWLHFAKETRDIANKWYMSEKLSHEVNGAKTVQDYIWNFLNKQQAMGGA
jgi:hypothetical protein